MEFKIRISNTFVMNLFMIVLAFGMAFFSFFYKEFRYTVFHYSYILWTLIFFFRLLVYYKPLYLSSIGKPALIVNEHYIFDVVKNIKYQWKDIDEIYEDNLYLYIKLYKPIDYIHCINNPARKLKKWVAIKLNQGQSQYSINMDIVNVNPNTFLEILNDYSITAIANENG